MFKYPLGFFVFLFISGAGYLLYRLVKGIIAAKKKEEEKPKPPAEEVVLLREIRDSLKN